MKFSTIFRNTNLELKESIRVDRFGIEASEDEKALRDEHYSDLLRTYHLTEEALEFLYNFFAQVTGRSSSMREGANHWLYGYYGSGKSHLLSLLAILTDSDWLERQPKTEVWDQLTSGVEEDLALLNELHNLWEESLGTLHMVPVSVNLLSKEEVAFADVVLEAAHVKQGLSPRLDVAYFEKWYRTTDAWSQREELATHALGELGIAGEFTWKDIQQYPVIAEVVLPRLFQQETGSKDGLADISPDVLSPDEVAEQLEVWRKSLQNDGKPVKLVLLLDEVSLFIGTNYERLTELNALAERIDEIGQGNIQMVVTAQERIEDVQPEYVAHGADFAILRDRFPHQYGLPSQHVARIVQHRLLAKSYAGQKRISSLLDKAKLNPEDTLVYAGIGRNLYPHLDGLDRQQVVDFYPLLPYQPALFMEILAGLRDQLYDRSKSIFSGTARAILAIAAGLLEAYQDRPGRDQQEASRLISLVDFYELIEPELKELVAKDVELISKIKRSYSEFDERVAKAVMLLRYVPDILPLSPHNIAVSIMGDLNGPTATKVIANVGDALERLSKFIRPNGREGALLRFTSLEEQEILESADDRQAHPDWESVSTSLGEALWPKVMAEVSIPRTIPFGKTEKSFPVQYEFTLGGIPLSVIGEHNDLQVTVQVRGVFPGEDTEVVEPATLYWHAGNNGIKELRARIINWWALYIAAGEGQAPPSIVDELSERGDAVVRGLVGALKSGSYQVREKELNSIDKAVKAVVNNRYPAHFHPTLYAVGQAQLRSLAGVKPGHPLPSWAREIEVFNSSQMQNSGSLQLKIRSLVGKELKKNSGELGLTQLLEVLVQQEPLYKSAEPAIQAIIWGLCRKSDFMVVDETGSPVDANAILDLGRVDLRLRLVPNQKDIKQLLERAGLLDTVESVDVGLQRLHELNGRLVSQSDRLREEVTLLRDNHVSQEPVLGLLSAFERALKSVRREAQVRIDDMEQAKADWQDVVAKSSKREQWLSEVQIHWGDRQGFILELDGLLGLLDSDLPWATDCQKSYQQLREGVKEGASSEWWTEDGWQDFMAGLPQMPQVKSRVESAYNNYIARSGMDQLYTVLKGDPWMVPLVDLPMSVQRGFKREILDPLGSFKQHFEKHQQIVDVFSKASHGGSPSLADVKRSLAAIPEIEKNSLPDTELLNNLIERQSRLADAAGDLALADVNAIGLWPIDKRELERAVMEMARTQDVDIESRPKGAIVRAKE